LSDNVTYSPPAQDVRANKPAIVTPGDPAGIGPEITLSCLAAGRKNIVLQGDIEHLGRDCVCPWAGNSFYRIWSGQLCRYPSATCHV